MHRDWQNSALLFLPPSLSSLPSSFPLSLVSIHPFFLFPLFPSLSLASLKLKFSKRQRMLESPSWTAGRNVIIAQKEAMLSLACTRQGRREHCNSQGLVLSQGLLGNYRESEGPWGVLLPPFPHPPRRRGRAHRRSRLGSPGWRAEGKGCFFRSSQARNFTEVRHTLCCYGLNVCFLCYVKLSSGLCSKHIIGKG